MRLKCSTAGKPSLIYRADRAELERRTGEPVHITWWLWSVSCYADRWHN